MVLLQTWCNFSKPVLYRITGQGNNKEKNKCLCLIQHGQQTRSLYNPTRTVKAKCHSLQSKTTCHFNDYVPFSKKHYQPKILTTGCTWQRALNFTRFHKCSKYLVHTGHFEVTVSDNYEEIERKDHRASSLTEGCTDALQLEHQELSHRELMNFAQESSMGKETGPVVRGEEKVESFFANGFSAERTEAPSKSRGRHLGPGWASQYRRAAAKSVFSVDSSARDISKHNSHEVINKQEGGVGNENNGLSNASLAAASGIDEERHDCNKGEQKYDFRAREKEIQEFLRDNFCRVQEPVVSMLLKKKTVKAKSVYARKWTVRSVMSLISHCMQMLAKVTVLGILGAAVAVLSFKFPGRSRNHSSRSILEPQAAFAATVIPSDSGKVDKTKFFTNNESKQRSENPASLVVSMSTRVVDTLTRMVTKDLGEVTQIKDGDNSAKSWHSGKLVAVAEKQALSLDVTPPNLYKFEWTSAKLSYMLDVLLERHPTTYVLFLMILCFMLVAVGGTLFHNFRHEDYGEALWEAWASVASPSFHLQEKTQQGRVIGLMLALGGLFFYSLLTSTMTAQFKVRMERLREGAHSPIMESQHIIVAGNNNRLETLLRQLNKSQEFAVRDGTAQCRRQTVLVLSEQERKVTEKQLATVLKDCPQINVLTRSGSLSSTSSFERVAADKARSIILLASKDDYNEADADSVLAILALQPLLEGKPGNVVVEVSKASTAELLRTLSGLNISPVEDLSAKLFVQCSRQPGLIDVYRRLLDHGKDVINLRQFSTLAGLPYRELRRGFREAVVCGLVRDGNPIFHPREFEILRETDKILVIAHKHTEREPPPALVEIASKYRKALKDVSGKVDCLTSMIMYDKILSANLEAIVQRPAKAQFKTADWTTAKKERILLLGWRPGVTDMIREYDDYVGPGSELVILAQTSLKERQRHIDRRIRVPLRNLRITHKIGSPMSRTDIGDAALDLQSKELISEDKLMITSQMQKDNLKVVDRKPSKAGFKEEKENSAALSIVVITDKSYNAGDGATPDKQSVFSLLLAEAVCRQYDIKLQSLVAELVDKQIGKQVVHSHPSITYISTSHLMGLVTSQVTEHVELLGVWKELLNSWGDEIYVKDIELYKRPGEEPTFAELAERAVLREEVAIGIRRNGKTAINPRKDVPLSFKSGDGLVLISEFEWTTRGDLQQYSVLKKTGTL